MQSTYYTDYDRRPGFGRQVANTAAYARDWLDRRGKVGWIGAIIVGFFIAPPVGVALLVYTIWSKRMFRGCSHRRDRMQFRNFDATGNSAFDAYREETLKRLEEERDEFLTFLTRLREAKDKAEFDQFMNERRAS
ncbi:DUF2852 domain-containing protein [Paracoccus pacificus]|uniref:DUF2852 domain-containing protein n=1 Tax=Paracoccus pacificus TaxID=1463598 RepID=A0ABW4RAF6_9RHOB